MREGVVGHGVGEPKGIRSHEALWVMEGRWLEVGMPFWEAIVEVYGAE